MDFGELLHAAKKNETSKPQVRYYPTKFAPPKKENRPKNLSVNVQKFLARKEAEEKQKQQEALERKSKLLALRSQDKKATRRVNVMLKRTKSANQSVIADALDENNTSVTLAGPSQPDEDDYGYVSQESSALYNKMMEKYSKMPDEPKFPEAKRKISTNLSSTKDRVKAALEREREEAMMPHRRKRKHTESTGDDSEKKIVEAVVEPEIEKKESAKVKFKSAPLVNFSDLLKLAEKKQFEPVVIEPKKEEEERPLTKKQKKEQEREREWRERKESRNKAIPEKPPTSNRIPKLNGSTPPQTSDKIPKKSSSDNQEVIKKVPANKEPALVERVKSLDKNSNLTKASKIPPSSNSANPSNNKRIENLPQKPLNGTKIPSAKISEKSRLDSKMMPPPSINRISSDKSKLAASKEQQAKRQPAIDNINSKLKQALQVQTDARMKQSPSNNIVKSKQQLPPKQFPPSDLKPRPAPTNNLKPKQFPPSDLKPKQFPPSDLKPKQFPPADVRRHPKDLQRKAMLNKRRIIDDDEDDYDPEMDDFIDDGPEDEPDYSKYISEIFGYDKRRYRNDDEDLDNMESSFAQQMKEEVISTRIGIMEDLEDMRQEEEAKKRKLQMKKRGKL